MESSDEQNDSDNKPETTGKAEKEADQNPTKDSDGKAASQETEPVVSEAQAAAEVPAENTAAASTPAMTAANDSSTDQIKFGTGQI